MKKFKKIFAVLLTLAMVLGMSMTTFAATSATITVKGEKAQYAENVTYVQVVEPDTTNPTGWKFTDSSYATAFKTAFEVATDDDAILKLIALGKLEDINYAAAGKINNVDVTLSSQFAAALKEINTKDNATKVEKNWTITASKAGLYVIKATAKAGYSYIPMAAYVGYNADRTELLDASVVAKGAKTIITKDIDNDDDKSVSEGDVVEYTATTEYPYYEANVQAKTFKVTDQLTNATFAENSVVVTVDGVTDSLKAGKDYTINEYAGTSSLEIDFNYNDDYAGKTVTIKYNAIVGAGEGDVVNKITTNLDTKGDSVTLDKVQVTIIKVSDDEEPVVLPDATFAIYEVGTAQDKGFIEYKNVAVFGEEELQTLYLKELVTGTTDSEGKVVFTGLDAQKTYYIKETNAPEGFSLNNNYYKLNPTTETTQANSKVYSFKNFADTTVADTKLSALPGTGGIGTTIFTIGGCLIMIAAAGLFFASRRKTK